MRPKYTTSGIVLSRSHAGEANAFVALLTPEFGLIRARVQGIRKPGAKLASALQTLSECEAMLLRGKDGWRLSGAVSVENWSQRLEPAARLRAGRVAALLLRLVHGESADSALFVTYSGFLAALSNLSPEAQDAAECLAALRIMRSLGLDAGPIPEDVLSYDGEALLRLSKDRRSIVMRVNRGLKASGL